MKLEDINKIKYGDYLEIYKFQDSDIYYGKVIHVSDPGLVYLERKIIWISIHPVFNTSDKITWNIEYIRKYVKRVIESPTEKRMIKLLYDC